VDVIAHKEKHQQWKINRESQRNFLWQERVRQMVR